MLNLATMTAGATRATQLLGRSYLLAAGLLAFFAAACAKPSAPPEEPPPIAPVSAENARLLTLAEWTDVLGTSQPLPNHIARVTAAIEGRVLPFADTLTEGREVKVDDPVVRLDTRLIDERRRQAETAVRLAQLDVDRLNALVKKGTAANLLVSPVDYEKARLVLEDVQSKRKALEEEVKLYTLRAPISGRLGLIQVVPGQTIVPGTAVAEILDLKEIDVLCFVPPHIANRLSLEQPARLVRVASDGKIEADPPTGKVVYLAVQAQSETGNFAVKVRFPNQDLALRASSVVRIQVQTRPEEARVTIPESALMEDSDPPTVVIVSDLKAVRNKDNKDEEQGKARKLRARIGVRDAAAHRVEIIGLETDKKEPVPLEGVLFVVKGGNGVQDGDPVKLEQEDDD